jgi:hypothetical protein
VSYYSDPESEVRDLREQVAELEAKLERCVRLAASLAAELETANGDTLPTPAAKKAALFTVWKPESAWIAAIRKALESPNSGERREGE